MPRSEIEVGLDFQGKIVADFSGHRMPDLEENPELLGDCLAKFVLELQRITT